MLIDIPLDKYHLLDSLMPSICNLSIKAVPKFRKVFSFALANLLANPNDSVLWKKFLLLPTILLTKNKFGNIKKYADKIFVDDYDFQVKDFLYSNKNLGQMDRNDYVQKCLQKGNIRKAMKSFEDENKICELNCTEIKSILESKHPNEDWNEEIVNELNNYDYNAFPIADVDPVLLRKIIQRSRKMVTPGIDKLRYEHLQAFVGRSSEPSVDEEYFTSLLAKLLTLFIKGKVPKYISNLMSENRLIALSKGDNDLRPIGIGFTLRKLASSISMNRLYRFSDDHFKSFQYGMHSSGCEVVIQSIAMEKRLHPELDIYCLDAKNAFNSIDRLNAIKEIKKNTPEAVPFIKDMYLHSTHGWFRNADDYNCISSNKGVHQGDVLSSWLFCMALQPLLENLNIHLANLFPQSSTGIYFYIDDGNIVGERKILIEAIKFIKSEGMKIGFELNDCKGAYLMGVCNSYEEANNSLSEIKEQTGIKCSILINPENDPANSADYGTKILGSYIGTDEFIKKSLMKHAEKLNGIAEKMIEYPDIQGRYILFRDSFMLKPVHLFRTIPTDICQEFLKVIGLIQKKVIASLFNCHIIDIPIIEYTLFNLDIKEGGLGLHEFDLTAKCSYAASVLEMHKFWKHIWPTRSAMLEMHFFSEVKSIFDGLNASPQYLEDFKAYPALGSIQNQLYNKVVNLILPTILADLKRSDKERESWFINTQCEEAGKWLAVKPCYRKMIMTNDQFISALRYRYHLRPINHISGSICICGKTLDENGRHAATCCSHKSFRIDTHNQVVHELNSILHYCGLWTKIEEKNVFASCSDSNLRPDIVVHNAPSTLKSNLLLDISITTPCLGSKGNAASSVSQGKVKKYNALALQSGYNFTPVIFQSTGLLCSDSFAYIKSLASLASRIRKISKVVLLNYFLKRLSIALQKGISDSINKRYVLINSHYPVENDPTFAEDMIYDS